MIFLGFGKYVRADKIYALEPLGEGERGHGSRTRVWVESAIYVSGGLIEDIAPDYRVWTYVVPDRRSVLQ